MVKHYCLELELNVFDEDEAQQIIEGLADHASYVPGVEHVETRELESQ